MPDLKSIDNKKLKIALLAGAAALLMVFIFFMSSMNGRQSQFLSWRVVMFLKRNIPFLAELSRNEYIQLINFNNLLRKIVHFIQYFTLSFIIYSIVVKFSAKIKTAVLSALFISLLYAFTDEFHQTFVRGRTALVSDIFIDFAGACAAMAVVHLVRRRKQNRENAAREPLDEGA